MAVSWAHARRQNAEMSDDQADRYERALHEAEVRLWVEERELELLADGTPEAVRADLEAEVARLRGVVDARRADVEHEHQPHCRER